jgi:error-prone DNA polymerase
VPDRVAAEIKDISPLDLAELARLAALESAATGTDDFRAVAPAVQSFASGRRR